MGQVLIRQLEDSTIEIYRAAAKQNGRSLESELREALRRAQPARPKDREALGALSRRLRAMTPPDGPGPGNDSTLDIRWDRDTDHGRWPDDGWADHLAGH